MYNYMNIPEELKNINQWVLWKKKENAKTHKVRKVPYTRGELTANVTNRFTWRTFQVEYDEYLTGKYDGMGFVLTEDDDIVFIDLDHCFSDEGVLNDFACEIVNLFDADTYIEYSQSKKGLHIFVKGTIPAAVKCDEIEMYSDKRFCAMTGDVFFGNKILENQDVLDLLYERFSKNKSDYDSKTTLPEINESMLENEYDYINRSDEQIIKKILSSKSADKFKKVFFGDISEYKSKSEADYDLCCQLAYWTNCDKEAILRIFSQSALCDAKWIGRQDYRDRTVDKVIKKELEKRAKTWK